MTTVLSPEGIRIAESRIAEYENRRLDTLKSIKLSGLLESNSYILRAEQEFAISTLLQRIMDEYFFYLEQELYEEFCRSIIFDFCKMLDSVIRSNFDGIDLEFAKDGIYYLIHVSGDPNWGNNRQIKYMIDSFKKARRILHTSNQSANIQAINGCCYGRDNLPDKGDYRKLCGQEFWEFISGDNRLFVDIVEPLGYRAKQRNDEFSLEYGRILNIFTNEFYKDFCTDGVIDWEKLVRFNSEKRIRD